MKRKAALELQQRLRRRALALAAEAEQALADAEAPLTPERVHRLRVICKHLRATWELLTPALGRSRTRPQERALRDAARVLAGSREAHVLGRTVIRLTRRHGDARLAGAGEAGVLAPVDAMEQLLDVIHDRWPDHGPPPQGTAALRAVFAAQRAAIERWPEAMDGDLLVAGIVRSYRRARRVGRRAMRGPATSISLDAHARSAFQPDKRPDIAPDIAPAPGASPTLRNAAGETLLQTDPRMVVASGGAQVLRSAAGEVIHGLHNAAVGDESPAAAAPLPAADSPADAHAVQAHHADEAWHACRRWVKYELYQLTLLTRRSRPGRRLRRLERFGERLGRFHDLCDLRELALSARERLAHAGALPGIERVLALEEAPLRRHLRRSFRRLYARPPEARRKRLARRLGRRSP